MLGFLRFLFQQQRIKVKWQVALQIEEDQIWCWLLAERVIHKDFEVTENEEYTNQEYYTLH